MWLALPDEVEDADPTVRHVKADELPVVDLAPLDLPVLAPSTSVRISSASGARLLLFGGERFASTRQIAVGFVASSPGKIRQWMTDYAVGQFPRIDRSRLN